jgi:hypothetical protein
MPHVERFSQINLARRILAPAKCKRGAKFIYMARKIGLVVSGLLDGPIEDVAEATNLLPLYALRLDHA